MSDIQSTYPFLPFGVEYLVLAAVLLTGYLVFSLQKARPKKVANTNGFIESATSEKTQLTACNQLENLAKNMGLTITPGTDFSPPSLQGTYRGIVMVVRGEQRIIDGQSTEFTVFEAYLDNDLVPPNLLVTSPHVGVSRDISPNVRLGDAEFDAAFIVHSAAPDHAREFLSRPNVKTCLLEMRAQFDNFSLENNTLGFSYEHEFGTRQNDALYEHIETLIRCAHDVSGTRYMDHMLEQHASSAPEQPTSQW